MRSCRNCGAHITAKARKDKVFCWRSCKEKDRRSGDKRLGHLAARRSYYAENRPTMLERASKIRKSNPEASRVRTRRWLKSPEGRAWNCRYANERTERVRRATPKWADRKAIEAVYMDAAKRNLTVDHVVPLVHPKVCGLHIAENLQLLTKLENCQKSNKWPSLMGARWV